MSCALVRSALFQSTLSVRRATTANLLKAVRFDISIHALRKESDTPHVAVGAVVPISIHALRKESDPASPEVRAEVVAFQSTLSVRRATGRVFGHALTIRISIHALRKESDMSRPKRSLTCSQFQSTLSVRRATLETVAVMFKEVFQSTLSVRRATVQLDIFVHFLRRKPAAWL